MSKAMQLAWDSTGSDDSYVRERGWERATLEHCPFHPEEGCGLERLGTYERVRPAGTRVPRWWCPTQGASISLLPSFLAARFSGTLAEVEAVVDAVERAGSVSAAVEAVYPADAERAIGLTCAKRALRRRVRAIRAALLAIATLLAERFAGVAPTLAAFREVLGLHGVLGALRREARRRLGALPVPLGFRARASG
jgi:hypothetical protein